MNRLTGFLMLIGIMLIGAASMMAIDTVMTEDRKSAIRDEIGARIDDGAAQYDARREEGCRRRCGFFSTMSKLATDLRDGIFAQLPYDPEEVLPPAPEGWQSGAYAQSFTEGVIGRQMQQTALASATHNRLLLHFDKLAHAAETGAVRLYARGDTHIAVAVGLDWDGLRDKPGRNPLLTRFGRATPSAITVNGLAFEKHPQISVHPLTDTRIAVHYHHYSMDFDGQARIDVIARATDAAGLAEIEAFLAGMDIAPIVGPLPRVPAGFQATSGADALAQRGG